MSVAPVVLLVDDDPAIRDSLSNELRALGYTTTTATDGRDGLRSFETRAPDLVLTDLAMPRSDGFELISAIRDPRFTAGTTECSTCKIQMEQGTTKPTIHPIKLLALAYGLMPDLANLLTDAGEELTVT